MSLLDDGCALDDFLEHHLGLEEGFASACAGCAVRGDAAGNPGSLRIGSGTHDAIASLGEGLGLDGIGDGGLGGAVLLHKSLCGADDVGGLHLEGHRAGAVGLVVLDGGGGGGLQGLGEGGDDFVILEGEVLDRGVTADLHAHHAAGEAAVGIHLGGTLGHDLLLSLGTGQGGIPQDVDDLVLDVALHVGVIRGGHDGSVLELLATDDAVEGVGDLANLNGADDLDLPVGHVLGLALGDGSHEGGLHGSLHLVVLKGEILNAGVGIDHDAVDTLNEEAVTIELGGTEGLQALLGAGLDPDLGELGALLFGGLHEGMDGCVTDE